MSKKHRSPGGQTVVVVGKGGQPSRRAAARHADCWGGGCLAGRVLFPTPRKAGVGKQNAVGGDSGGRRSSCLRRSVNRVCAPIEDRQSKVVRRFDQKWQDLLVP
jgi:hypothetical protein